MDSPHSPTEYDALFHQYLDVCNAAISSHREEFPYKQIWGAVRHSLEKGAVRVAIYDDQPKTEYEIHLEDDHIEAEADRHAADAPVWRMNLSYLLQVVEHPEEYIQNPARLDWDWLKSRVHKS